MTIAMFRAMFLNLLHDRGALLMAFLLPIIFFLVLAEIFSSASGSNMQVRVAIANEVGDDNTQRLIDAMLAGDAVEEVTEGAANRQQVEKLVRKGAADVGVIFRADARSLDDVGGFGAAPILLINDPVRAVSVPMLSGQIQQAYFEALPDVALGSVVSLLEEQYIELDEEQREDLDDGLSEMREQSLAGLQSGWSFGDMLERQDVAGQSRATNDVAYYAGAVAFLFLLFACMQGALSLAEERDSGILDRILAGPGGIAVLVNGKFLFLIAQGFIQVLIIFVTAWQIYGVDLPANFVPWMAVTLVACVAAAGFSLAVVAACKTVTQAQNLLTVLILIMSIVGGSMVPRFLMPLWLRDLGWLTPNTWVLEAYSAIFWRGEGLGEVLLPCGLLTVFGLTGLLCAQWLAGHRARL